MDNFKLTFRLLIPLIAVFCLVGCSGEGTNVRKWISSGDMEKGMVENKENGVTYQIAQMAIDSLALPYYLTDEVLEEAQKMFECYLDNEKKYSQNPREKDVEQAFLYISYIQLDGYRERIDSLIQLKKQALPEAHQLFLMSPQNSSYSPHYLVVTDSIHLPQLYRIDKELATKIFAIRAIAMAGNNKVDKNKKQVPHNAAYIVYRTFNNMVSSVLQANKSDRDLDGFMTVVNALVQKEEDDKQDKQN